MSVDISGHVAPTSSEKEAANESSQFGVETDAFLDSQPQLVNVKKYQAMVERVARRESKSIDVWVDDVEHWIEEEEAQGNFTLLDPELRQEARMLASRIETNTLRYVGLMEQALDAMVKEEKEKNPSLFTAPARFNHNSQTQRTHEQNAATQTEAMDEDHGDGEEGEPSKPSSHTVQAKLLRQ